MMPTDKKKGGLDIAILAGGSPKVRGPEDTSDPNAQDSTGADNPPGESCSTCHYFKGGNTCKRYPEAIPKRPTDWSGEWLPKSQSKPDNAAEESAEPPGMSEGMEGEQS
jgi:hypothetical protein